MREKLNAYLVWAGAFLAIVAFQLVVGGLISISGVEPDLLLIAIVFMAITFGQVPAMSFAFAYGLLLDLYGGELIGISALALTISAFVVGFFHDPERVDVNIRSYSIIWMVSMAAVIRNLVSIFAYFQSLDFDILSILSHQMLLGALYTTCIAVIPVLILVRTGSRLKV